MSSKSIRAYQERYGKPMSTPDRLREHAARLRNRCQSILTQACELEELAESLDPPRLSNCDCGTPLTLCPGTEYQGILSWSCYCDRCKARSDATPGVTFVYGYGRDKATALADWRQRMDSF